MVIRLPEMALQIDAPAQPEFNAFGFQQKALIVITARQASRADFSPGIDDPVPGNLAVIAEGRQCVTDLTCMTWVACQRGDLSVGGYTAFRDAFHGFVNALI